MNELRAQPHGTLAFLAQPSGPPWAAFAPPRTDADDVVFPDLGHEFPQRVAYARDGSGRVEARIGGPLSTGSQRVVRFPMRRTACDTLRGLAPR